MKKLTQAEIDHRMIQWRNDRALEIKRKECIEKLEKENAELRATVATQQQTIEKLLLRVEQLEAMVFGRKKRKPDDYDDLPPASSGRFEKPPRPATSFRRAIPPPEEINNRTYHPLASCPDCGHYLQRRNTVTRFVEDIPLPQKVVVEQTIERGFCPCCKKTKSALPISPQHCSLGQNVRLYILFAVTVLGLTFGKVRAHLSGLHGLSLSDGELAAIIREGHEKLLPALHEIEGKIRAAPAAHYDETSYPVQQGEQGNYAWVKTSSTGPETIFRLGRTRGKGNAQEIRGSPSDQVGVSDDYAAYGRLFRNHALCWAHPLRKSRDLAKSGALSSEHHEQCRNFYERFCVLERSVAVASAAPLAPEERIAAIARTDENIDTLMAPDERDIPALAKLKRTFLENKEKYLLCLRIPGVPMTNNKAERSLRHLVIKRLLSFGSRSQRGAQAMETILSVLLTLWWSKPKDYFAELRKLMSA